MQMLRKLFETYTQKRKIARQSFRTFMALASIIVFVSSYLLILPAITMDRETASADAGILYDDD